MNRLFALALIGGIGLGAGPLLAQDQRPELVRFELPDQLGSIGLPCVDVISRSVEGGQDFACRQQDTRYAIAIMQVGTGHLSESGRQSYLELRDAAQADSATQVFEEMLTGRFKSFRLLGAVRNRLMAVSVIELLDGSILLVSVDGPAGQVAESDAFANLGLVLESLIFTGEGFEN